MQTNTTATAPQVGSANVYESTDSAGVADTPYMLLSVTENLLPGIEILSAAGAPGAYAYTLLCAQALENALKAVVVRSPSASCLKARDIRHNLAELWLLAAANGLPITTTVPPWVKELSHLYFTKGNGGHPVYYLRYPEGVNGFALPTHYPMAAEVKALAVLARQRLQTP